MRVVSILLAISTFSLTTIAKAEDGPYSTKTAKKVMIVSKAAMYGAAGGLVVGLASQAFKKKSRNILIFTSLGLYTGIGMGLYAVLTSRGGAPYEGPDTYEDDFASARERLLMPLKEREYLAANTTANDAAEISLFSFNF